MPVHHKVTPAVTSPVPFIDLGGESHHDRPWLAQEHNIMSLARARTWSAWSGAKCTYHETTVPSKENGVNKEDAYTYHTCTLQAIVFLLRNSNQSIFNLLTVFLAPLVLLWDTSWHSYGLDKLPVLGENLWWQQKVGLGWHSWRV